MSDRSRLIRRAGRWKELAWAWLPTVLYGGLILLFALQPSPKLPRIKNIDKYLHVLLYGVLSLLAYRSLVHSGVRYPATHAIWIACLVGLADERVQFLGGARRADRFDLLADGIGAALAMTAMVLWRWRSDRRGRGAAGSSGGSSRH